MVDTLVYAITRTNTPYLMTVLEWGPQRVKATATATGDLYTEFTHIEIHEQGEVHVELLEYPVKVYPSDQFIVTFPSSPHQKMLHLLKVSTQEKAH